MEPEAPVYERIVLKVSGEAMHEHGGRDNISPTVVRSIAERMKEVRDLCERRTVDVGLLRRRHAGLHDRCGLVHACDDRQEACYRESQFFSSLNSCLDN